MKKEEISDKEIMLWIYDYFYMVNFEFQNLFNELLKDVDKERLDQIFSEQKIINFKTLQENCKYAKTGYKFHGSNDGKRTCRHPKNIKPGKSWGKCKMENCPIVGP